MGTAIAGHGGSILARISRNPLESRGSRGSGRGSSSPKPKGKNNYTLKDITEQLDDNIDMPTPGYMPENCWHYACKPLLDPKYKGVPRGLFTNFEGSHVEGRVFGNGIDKPPTEIFNNAPRNTWGMLDNLLDPLDLNITLDTLRKIFLR